MGIFKWLFGKKTEPGPLSSHYGFSVGLNDLAEAVHRVAREHGFWDDEVHPAVKLCLMHSEISEALEWLRSPEMKDGNFPDTPPVAIEMADLIIRVLDFCAAYSLDIEQALAVKMSANERRPMKHDKTF